MQVDVLTLSSEMAGVVELSEALFGVVPRPDIMARMVQYQLAKRRAGTHKAKTRAEISLTGKKFVRQKGSGGARHGSRRVSQFRGGGKVFGPVPRSHAIALPKKVRALALVSALSSKAQEGKLLILDKASMESPKTSHLVEVFDRLKLHSALFVDGAELNENFALAARNIPKIDVLPLQGINVYDILRRETLVLTRAALQGLEARFL